MSRKLSCRGAFTAAPLVRGSGISPLKLPIGAAPAAGGPVCTFVYIDPGHGTPTGLRHWGQDHAHVWTILRKRGFKIHVAAVALNPGADDPARNVLNGWDQNQEGIRIDTFEIWRSRRIISQCPAPTSQGRKAGEKAVLISTAIE